MAGNRFPEIPADSIFGRIRTVLRAARVSHWAKNALVLVPIVASHQFSEYELWCRVLLTFLSFSLVSSANYLANDILDVSADRKHPMKRYRPLAAGQLTVTNVFLIAFVFLVAGFITAFLISPKIFVVVLLYWALACFYNLYLKRVLLLDVFILALFYTFRLLAGGEAAEVPLSFWLICFSSLLFISLSLVKRFADLTENPQYEGVGLTNRDYLVSDRLYLASAGIGSGHLAVVVLALYSQSVEVSLLYRRPEFLWLACLALLYWIMRLWLLANRGAIGYDPIEFAIRDRVSYVVLVFIGLTVWLAM